MRFATRALVMFPLLLVAATAAGRSVPLVDAAKDGDEKAVRALVQQHRVDVNAAEPDGTTALHWAAHRGDLATVDLLVRSGARATVVNSFGVTPLALAAESGNAAVVERLLKVGAIPDTRQNGGET